MADPTDVLLELWKDQRDQARQSEDQRAALTNIVIVIAAAGLGFISQQGRLRAHDLLVTVPLFFLGLYGSLTCWKYRERTGLHRRQARRLHKAIAELHPTLNLASMRSESYTRHEARFHRTVRIRLYALWMGLHVGVALSAAALSIWIATR